MVATQKTERNIRPSYHLEPVEEFNPNSLYRFCQIQHILGGVSRPTVREWIKKGRFPEPFSLSGRISLWRGKDLLNYFEKGIVANEKK